MMLSRPLIATSLLLICAIITACLSRKPLPAAPGMTIQTRPAKTALSNTDPKANQTLQVYWFGSGCHLLKLGNQTVLLDPFFTNSSLFVDRDQRKTKVQAILRELPRPQAILVNHSHFDHFLDAKTALETKNWNEVPLYGGQTCRHILAGWQEPPITKQVVPLPEEGGFQKVQRGLSFHSYRSSHSPHLSCGYTFLDHTLTRDRTSPPRLITDYPAGETYNFLIRMRSTQGPPPHPEFTIFYLAAPADLEKFPDSVPESLPPIDLVIVPAPGQNNVAEFPLKHFRRLQPRHILINHFNHFLKENKDLRLQILGKDLARPEELARKLQDAVNLNDEWKPRFEAIHIPSLTEVVATVPAQNVVLIEK